MRTEADTEEGSSGAPCGRSPGPFCVANGSVCGPTLTQNGSMRSPGPFCVWNGSVCGPKLTQNGFRGGSGVEGFEEGGPAEAGAFDPDRVLADTLQGFDVAEDRAGSFRVEFEFGSFVE